MEVQRPAPVPLLTKHSHLPAQFDDFVRGLPHDGDGRNDVEIKRPSAQSVNNVCHGAAPFNLGITLDADAPPTIRGSR